MKPFTILFVFLLVIVSCKKKNDDSTQSNPHVANAPCGNCHTTEQTQWSSSLDLHAASTADVLTNSAHDSAELLNDDCLKCHSMFQYSLGVAHFVTPVNQTGSPAGHWTALNTGDWQATRCEVCHNPAATNKSKLAKYGAILDGQFNAGYIDVSTLPAAYQKIINHTTGDTSTYIYPDQTVYAVKAMKLCNSCHDPADEGGDPAVIIGGINYGAQGGDSRVYVGDTHQGFSCIDCHSAHTFAPVDPLMTTACKSCHTGPKTGKVHFNHI